MEGTQVISAISMDNGHLLITFVTHTAFFRWAERAHCRMQWFPRQIAQGRFVVDVNFVA
jgi:hypothetical protein